MAEIDMRYECEYEVETRDPRNPLASTRKVRLKAKKIVVTETDTTFYDHYECVSGYFRNMYLIGYIQIEQ